MEVLILSCGTGGGHNSAGTAVAEEVTRRGHHAVMLNPYTLHSDRTADWINRLYLFLAQKAPGVFGAVYGLGELYRRLPFRSPVYFANRAMAPMMREYLEKNRFDVIITPHLFPAEILTNMKHEGLCTPAVIFVATDYICIPFTEETDCDAYVIPSAELAEVFAGYGLPRRRLYPLGIPVQSCFRQNGIRAEERAEIRAGERTQKQMEVCTGERAEERMEARKRLGLLPDRKYILVAGGSMGGGSIRRAVQILMKETAARKDTELIVVCGHNRRLYEELSAQGQKRSGVRVVGFIRDMADYMKAADVFVTKPGGLSSTEAASCGVPLVHVAAIPGCETYNARYFSSHGMSRACRTSKNGLRAVFDLLDDEQLRSEMIRRQQEQIHPDAAVQICGLAESLSLRRWDAASDMEEKQTGGIKAVLGR